MSFRSRWERINWVSWQTYFHSSATSWLPCSTGWICYWFRRKMPALGYNSSVLTKMFLSKSLFGFLAEEVIELQILLPKWSTAAIPVLKANERIRARISLWLSWWHELRSVWRKHTNALTIAKSWLPHLTLMEMAGIQVLKCLLVSGRTTEAVCGQRSTEWRKWDFSLLPVVGCFCPG